MSPSLMRRRSVPLLATAGLLLSGLGIAGTATAGPTTVTPGTVLPGTDSLPLDPFTSEVNGLDDLDTRAQVSPLASQRAAVPAGATVRWNRYGTPASLSRNSGHLSGSRSGSAADASRAWLRGNAALFGLSSTEINDLELVNDSKLVDSTAHVVLFRQKYGALPAAFDGMVTLGLAPGNRVTYVSSSLSRDTSAPAAGQRISPTAAWAKAASQVQVPTAGIGAPGQLDDGSGWTVFTVEGLQQLQRARLRALALPGGGVRPAYETNVVDSGGGKALAYTSVVDAISGKVLLRTNQVDNLAGGMPAMTDDAQAFQGEFTATECGPITPDPNHTITVDTDTKTITAAANADVAANDIIINIIQESTGDIVANNDTGTSPEAAVYSPAGGVPAGDYSAEICSFENAVPIGAGTYQGIISASSQGPGEGIPYPPIWKDFVANPVLAFGAGTTDNRVTACWVRAPGEGCDQVLNNLAARAPWDVSQRTNLPTFTTIGNAATTAESWVSPLTPGPIGQRPVSMNRHYGYDNPMQDFTDAWNNSKCRPTNFTPGGNDILASVANLFAGHNRIHDFSYFLGFTEANYNLQDVNFGLTQPGPFPGREGDPEVGNVQAGATFGFGAPGVPVTGRNNANQITLQDGIPGITNQYLFQPQAGGFYAPCADGDFDAPIYGHEYTHAISNRMVAGPDSGLSGFQAGSMGESWSDQVALEYLFEHDYDIGAVSPWVEGAYATGNKVTGIRNYALDENPLQYGDLGYDVTGPEVHADGEVWSAAMFDVRRELVAKHNGRFPESDERLQLRCSMGATAQQPPATPLAASRCPGGRRWIQLMFDSFLLQQSGTSMLDARDAFLAADRMRFGGDNQAAIWRGFASDGMGTNAATDDTEDDQPTSGYVSPLGPEGTLRITARGFEGTTSKPIPGKLFVGKYEGRVTPIADTNPNTSRPNTVKMVPGRYSFVFQADGYGLFRFNETIRAGQTTAREVHLSFNSASSESGAEVDGSSANSLNAAKLLDDTEASNWAGRNPAGVSVDTPGQHPFVNVDLAGQRQLVRSVRVSAMLRPADPDQDEQEDMPDNESGSRFTALRKFAIETCRSGPTTDCSSSMPSGPGSPYTRIYTSPNDAFDGVKPRPVAPTLLFKRFDVPDTAATHVRLVALENQCTGQAQFADDQDNDPAFDSDCKTGNTPGGPATRDESVRASELEVFSYDTTTRPSGDPLVAMTMTGDLTAEPGDTVNYDLTYRNLGPKKSTDAKITIEELPVGLRFTDATGSVGFDSTNRRILWRLGDVRVDREATVSMTAKVTRGADLGDVLITTAQFSGKQTFSPPAAAVTVVGPDGVL